MIVLPYPPSLNDLYGRRGNYVYKKKSHRDYTDVVHAKIKALKIKPTDKPICISLVLYRPKKTGDIDNYFKTIFDSLAQPMEKVGKSRVAISPYGLYLNDNQIDELHVYKSLDRDNPRVEITYFEL